MNHTSTANRNEQALSGIVVPIQRELEDSIRLLSSYMRNEIPFVNELLQHGNMLSGKRLRPIVLLLVAGACGKIDPRHMTLAAAIEMIHTATLIHDDILDQASTRRHHETIHCKWDTQTSVLLGDYLFSNAFYLASTTDSAAACRIIGSATNLVCEGELQQVAATAKFELQESDYFEIIAGKTGQLIACATRLGSFFHESSFLDANGSENGRSIKLLNISQQMEEFGHNVGIAFQIGDDVLDLTGTDETTGKTLRTDLVNQKPTLPVIFALNRLPAIERKSLLELLKNPTPSSQQQILEVLQQTGSIESSLETAKKYSALAAQNLQCLDESRYRESLESITNFLTTRSA